MIGKPTVYASDKVKMKLSEGKYIIRAKIYWVDQQSHEFTLSTFSQYPSKLRKINSEQYSNFLSRVYLDAGRNVTDKYDFGKECKFASGWCGSHLFFYCVNKGKKKWTLTIKFKKLANLTLGKPNRQDESTLVIKVSPGKDQVAYAKRISEDPVGIDWDLQNAWE